MTNDLLTLLHNYFLKEECKNIDKIMSSNLYLRNLETHLIKIAKSQDKDKIDLYKQVVKEKYPEWIDKFNLILVLQ